MEFIFGLEDVETLAVEWAAEGQSQIKGSNAADYFMLLGELSGYSGDELKTRARKLFRVRKAEVLYAQVPRMYYSPAQRRVRHSA